jgi:hypothetical protein
MSTSQGIVRLERLVTLEKFDDVGTRTRDLPYCSVAPQPLRYRVPLLNKILATRNSGGDVLTSLLFNSPQTFERRGLKICETESRGHTLRRSKYNNESKKLRSSVFQNI